LYSYILERIKSVKQKQIRFLFEIPEVVTKEDIQEAEILMLAEPEVA